MSSVKHLTSLGSGSNLLCKPKPLHDKRCIQSLNFNTLSTSSNIISNNNNNNNNYNNNNDKYASNVVQSQQQTTTTLFHTAQQQQQHQHKIIRRSAHTLVGAASNFRQMAGIQRLANEPTREHIENIRDFLRNINAKDNSNQEISLEKDVVSGIALVRFKSAAKNGISGKMMCDFLDVLDELYQWDEGKGVIFYGHNNFFCSGKCTALQSLDYMTNYYSPNRIAID